jgi:hypothetical protein
MKQRRTPLAGGFILMMCIMAGVVVGVAKGQSSIGFLAGTGIGLFLLLLFWLIERNR